MAELSLAYLYHVYPGRDWISEPLWLVSAMQRSLPAVLATDQLRQAVTVRSAMWANKAEFQRFMERLQRDMQPYREPVTAVRPVSERARQWFIDNGIKVIEA